MATRRIAWVAALAFSLSSLAFAHPGHDGLKTSSTPAAKTEKVTKAATATTLSHQEFEMIVAKARSLTNERFLYQKLGLDMAEHSGGLNKCGCHFDHKTGDCHCHQATGICGCACSAC